LTDAMSRNAPSVFGAVECGPNDSSAHTSPAGVENAKEQKVLVQTTGAVILRNLPRAWAADDAFGWGLT